MALPYFRVRLQGSLPGGEVWSVNPAFIPNFTTHIPSDLEMQTWADDVLALEDGFCIPTDLRTLLSSAGSVDRVRVEWFETGTTLTKAAEAVAASPLPGLGGVKCPQTTSVVSTLHTGLLGRSYRGRLYWPALGATLSGIATIATPLVADIASAAATWLQDVAGASPGTIDAVPAVWSSKKGGGVAVTSVLVGNVPDNMSTRKDHLSESYASATLG